MRTIQHEGTFYTYSYLLNGAYNAIETAREYRTGSNYQRLSAILFAAFALEAHLNHVGEQKLQSWADIERKLNPDQKLALVAEVIGFNVDRSRRPFQNFREIFQFRNYFAHGRTESIERTVNDDLPREADIPSFDPQMIERLSDQYVGRLYEDAKQMITALHTAAGFGQHQIGLISSGMSTIE